MDDAAASKDTSSTIGVRNKPNDNSSSHATRESKKSSTVSTRSATTDQEVFLVKLLFIF
jgi:hypothetical protein